MSLTYAQYQAEIASLTQFNPGDPFFIQNLPSALDYAYDRIYRELNLLNAVTSNSSLILTAGTRSLDITTAGFNILSDVNIITPYTTTNPELGLRNPATICDRSFMNSVYGSNAVEGVPVNYAFLDNFTLLFGPFPDHAYTVELIGTTFPVPISSGVASNFVSEYLPDLLVAASMVFMTGAQKNFGAQSIDPQAGMSWEAQYGKLRDSAATDDARRRFMSVGYTSQLPSPASPQRT